MSDSTAPISLRAAVRMMGWEGNPVDSARRLLRRLRAIEARDGRALVLKFGGAGCGTRYAVSLEALRVACPEYFPTRRDELAETIRTELGRIEERLAARIEEVSDRCELVADTVVEFSDVVRAGA